jgi:predicted transcriptional regulator
MKQDEILDLENRKIIYDYINKYPGIHLSGLFKNLNMSRGTIRYHLKYLEQRELIIIKKENGYNRYYSKNESSAKFKEILSVVRRRTPRNIILTILIHTGASQKEIADELGRHPTTIYAHIQELVERDIIERVPVVDGMILAPYKNSRYMKYNKVGREVVYRLTDPYLIYDLLVVYKDKLLDDGATSNILEFFESMFPKKKPKMVGSLREGIDSAINAFYEMFPPSFVG